MTIRTFFKGTLALLAACWIQVSAAQGSTATDLVTAYVSEAIAVVNTIYESELDAQERSMLIRQSGINDYWVSGRQTVIEGKGSGAAFAALLGFRADSWTLDDFKQAGDFGELAVVFSRTKTFRSGEQSTAEKELVYEMVKVGDSWSITSFRTIENGAKEVTTWDQESDKVNVSEGGMSPLEVVTAQMDLLRGLPPQELRSASDKSEPLWQDTREARQAQARVISTVATMTSFSSGPVDWTLAVLEQGQTTATVKAVVVADKPVVFSGLLLSLAKINDKWLLSGATVTR